MKKVLYMLFIAALFLASCKSNLSDQVVVKGDIDGIENETIYLKVIVDRKVVDLDSAQVKNGHFVLKGKITEPQMARLSAKNEDVFPTYELYIEPGEIKISGHAGDSDFTVTGSKSHAEMKSLQKELAPFEERSKTIYESYMAAAREENTQLMQEFENQFDALDEEMKSVKEAFIKNNPKSHFSLYMIRTNLIYSATLEDLEKYQSWIAPEMLDSELGKFLTDRIEILKKVAVGQPAPEVSLQDTSGVVINLSSLKGNYVLVDFWASWCGPCRRENPNVVAAYQTFHDKGFDIFGISLDDNSTKWKEAINADHLTWYQVIDNGWNSESVKAYGVMSIPSNYLLDKDGNIIATQLRGEKLHEKLTELLD